MFDEIGVLYRGLMLGFMIAAPVGPVGLLCIRRTAQKGLPNGFATGVGAACADTIFGAVAVLGISVILEFMTRYDLAIRVFGGAVLLFGAYHTWHDHPRPPQDPMALVRKVFHNGSRDNSFIGLLKACLSGLAITLTNPITMFATMAVVATFGHPKGGLDAASMVGGIFIGSVSWWLLLSGSVALVRGHFTEARIVMTNRVTAVILAGFGVWTMATALTGLAMGMPPAGI
ncbi:MAG: LysE family transporter [Bdellovibrionales bacterium]